MQHDHLDRDFQVVPPPGLRDDGREVPYTALQLEPTLRRLRDALELDLASVHGPPQQRLAAAWTRIGELRLPRKAVPNQVLDEIERLVTTWDTYGHGGIVRHAFSLTPAEVERETTLIAWMLAECEAAAEAGTLVQVVPTD